jgi:hypothetical protein
MESLATLEDLDRPRPSYADMVELAFQYLDIGRAGVVRYIFGSSLYENREIHAFLRRKRKETADAFYNRQWTVEEILAELRDLARDVETTKFYRPALVDRTYRSFRYDFAPEEQYKREQRELYEEALRLELIDSPGDLQRKAEFLFRKLLKLDFVEFVMTAGQIGLQSLTACLQAGALLHQAFDGVAGTSVESVASKLHRLAESKDRLKQLYPEAANEIDNLIETERMKLAGAV